MTIPEMPILNRIAQVIFDKKGMNILGLDVRGISSMTDYVIIAEGNVDRHVVAIAQAVIGVLKQAGELPIHVEGLQTGDWVVIDFLDIMVHLFMPGLREKYRLEDLWKEGRLLDLTIDTSH
ncbi:MAG: ribosome silencing factor [Rhabdochlamydiaceae bacterium]|nr:ribosome silencing factor [Rhabdochlamydiaceae bacterium]